MLCAVSLIGAALLCAADAPSPPLHSAVTPADLDTAKRSHWAYQPVASPQPPVVKDAAWCRSPIDNFILAKLEAAKLRPSPEADRRTLLRRLSYDLTGLPPTAAQLDQFAADKSPNAYEQQVDRLLASPAYGQRWGRHWLDVARYADTAGYVGDTADDRLPFAYTYRDYVIRAFNADLPYDRFITEQLAADQLDLGEDKRPLAALGFLTVGRRFINNIHDITDDRIDVVTRGLMGLTLQCARCHDHKYDALPTADYYALYGVFRSSVEPEEPPQIEKPADSPEQQKYQAELDKRKKDRADYIASLGGRQPNQGEGNKIREFTKKINEWLISSPQTPPHAMVMNDGPLFSPHVFLRGNSNSSGEAVPRRFLSVLSDVDGGKPFPHGSGRLDLAHAIASPKNPLTPRVMINRIWQHHFGSGLVRTTSDFGVRGDPPTHPELLDWLAARFVAEGWSVKKMHKLIVCSAAYRQQSNERKDAATADPENRLLWRMNRTRLEWESMHDAMLAVAGRLDEHLDGRPQSQFKQPFTTRRAVYGTVDRQDLPETLRNFDFPNSEASCPARPVTMVPQQALFMLNSAFVAEQAKAIAERPEVRNEADPNQRIAAAYRIVLGRAPETAERDLALKYVTGGGPEIWADFAQALLMSNEFVFVD